MNNPRVLILNKSYFSKNDLFKLVLVFEGLVLALLVNESAVVGDIPLSL